MNEEKLSKKINGFTLWATSAGMLIAPWIMYGKWFWELTGPSAILGFLISAILVIPIGLVIAELCAMMPQTGGSFLYVSTAFDKRLGFMAGWLSALSYNGLIASASTLSIALLQLIGVLPQSQMLRIVVAGSTVIFFYILNKNKVDVSTKLSMIITIGLIICGVVINGGLLGFSGQWSLENFKPFFTNGTSGFYSTIGIFVTLYFGFEAIPQFIEETNISVKKTANILIMAIVTAWAMYTIAFLGITGVTPVQTMLNSDIAAATIILDVWSNSIIGQAGFMVAIGITLLGSIAAGNGFWMALTRLYLSLAKDDEIPRAFTKLNKNQVPLHANTLVFAVVFCLVTFAGDKWLEILFLIMTLSITIVFLLVCLSFIKLRLHSPNVERPFKLPFGITIGVIGVLSSIYSIYCAALALSTKGWLFFVGYIVLGLIIRNYHKYNQKKKNAKAIEVA